MFGKFVGHAFVHFKEVHGNASLDLRFGGVVFNPVEAYGVHALRMRSFERDTFYIAIRSGAPVIAGLR